VHVRSCIKNYEMADLELDRINVDINSVYTVGIQI